MATIKMYEVATICTNCNHIPTAPCLYSGDAGHVYLVKVKIPRGIKTTDFLKNKKCKSCGCKGTIRQYK